jgi:asparagine synthase (glutamine-hydrolysing)
VSGICGIIQLDGAQVERSALEQMVRPVVYRGPHGIHYHLEGAVGMACLSLDTTPDGTGRCEPVVDAGRQVVFAADTRLDNRKDLVEAGADPRTDSEVMLAVLGSHADLAAGRLLGDFACALWDGRRRELRLTRDAMGMRSLYYRVEPGRVLFATELKQILVAGGVPRRLNEQAVAWHLAGMQVPAGCVFYEGIGEVRPAEEVTIDAAGQVRQRIFWRPDPSRRLRYRAEGDYADQMRDLLIDSVRCRLRARSPVAISLSGGMDSGSVASIAGWLREEGESLPALQAYSWTFTDFPECDERENIYRIADRYGIPVQEIAAESTYPLADYPNHGPHEDDPFVGMYQPFIDAVLAAALADRASVIFYGNRGDMMCGGGVDDVPGLVRHGLFREARRELGGLSRAHGVSRWRALQRYLVTPALSDLLPTWARVGQHRFASDVRRRLGGRGSATEGDARVGPAERAEPHVSGDLLRRAGLPLHDPIELEAMAWSSHAARERYRCVYSPLVMRVMMYAERLSAGVGLGFADPWSDRRLAEFVLACPQHLISRLTEAKRLPRRAMHAIMPAEAIRAARKVSPEPLYRHAVCEKAYGTVLSLMSGSRCAQLGYVDEGRFRDRFERLARGEAPMFDLWSTLSLELWLRRYWA